MTASLIPHREVLAEELRDPEMRDWYAQTAPAREMARAVLAYRVEHGLSQRALAARMGVNQAAVARLEDGES